MKLLANNVILPTAALPEPPAGVEDAEHIRAHLFEVGGIFVTADDWGNVLLWTPRYDVGNPTRLQVMLAATCRKKDPQDITDLDLFLVGGAEPTTVIAPLTAN